MSFMIHRRVSISLRSRCNSDILRVRVDADAGAIDYEADQSHVTFTLTVSDGVNQTSQQITLNVTDYNYQPGFITMYR